MLYILVRETSSTKAMGFPQNSDDIFNQVEVELAEPGFPPEKVPQLMAKCHRGEHGASMDQWREISGRLMIVIP